MKKVTNLPKWVEILLSVCNFNWTGCLKISNFERKVMINCFALLSNYKNFTPSYNFLFMKYFLLPQ